MQRTKIIHIIGSLTKGGAERFVVDLCNELAKEDRNEVYLVSICKDNPKDNFINDIHSDVQFISFNKERGFSFSVFLKLTRWLKNERPDIVHSHLNGFEYLTLYLLQTSNTRFFHTIHSNAEFECPNYIIKTFRKIFFRTNKVCPITISEDGSKTFRSYYHLSNDILIENGRPDILPTIEYNHLVKKYRSNTDSFLLLHVGSITAPKNQELLIKAVLEFNAREEKKCKLLIIGEIKDTIIYERLIQIVNNNDYIEFLGGKQNVVDYLNIADAFCLSSSFEGMPISLIEALSVGCIPICTPVGGITQMISHGKTGFLSKDGSVQNYYEAIKEALYFNDPESIKLNSMLSFKSKYTIKRSARNYSDTYLNMLATERTVVAAIR
ncbi:glycosyltransferase [Pedobacter nyackensis]|uniref:Glycosyltransferase involved in cell wall bisynthesis n=1 Tax=Pedobacter nyackensis TaxID=475255 RepID=A0A1W2DCF5_9SPHI|nr:glycosyltransferase [Pedobacter nyackensis]SMC95150.1 Glycosyltransferase involved in cell wall bisynthesis [Pedobacter nyackensis]